jgi:hypothetical protein
VAVDTDDLSESPSFIPGLYEGEWWQRYFHAAILRRRQDYESRLLESADPLAELYREIRNDD